MDLCGLDSADDFDGGQLLLFQFQWDTDFTMMWVELDAFT